MKPLGQRYVDITLPDGSVHKVDRDVEVVRRTFGLETPWECMSPVVFPPGYTRDCIDGKVSTESLLSRIKDGFTTLATKADFTLLEGSGHMGVGSIANLNNAQVHQCHFMICFLPVSATNRDDRVCLLAGGGHDARCIACIYWQAGDMTLAAFACVYWQAGGMTLAAFAGGWCSRP